MQIKVSIVLEIELPLRFPVTIKGLSPVSRGTRHVISASWFQC